MNDKLIFTSCQPDHPYFAWQLELQFLNFQDLGIELGRYHVLVSTLQDEVSLLFQDLQKRYPEVNFFFFKDSRIHRSYIPSLKPHLMSKFYHVYDTSDKVVVYIDSDVIFREIPNFEPFCEDDNTIWMSDTSSYLNSSYIKSKGSTLLDEMCAIVGVTTQQVEEIDKCSGGAQYILKGLDASFWDKVEKDSTPLYNFMRSSETTTRFAKEYALRNNTTEDKYHPIQAWCSEMWTTLWNFLYVGKSVAIHKELNFCFATSPSSEYNSCKILHNAGVTSNDKDKMFFKGQFINGLPDDLDLSYVLDKYSSFYYASYVKKLLELRKKSLNLANEH